MVNLPKQALPHRGRVFKVTELLQGHPNNTVHSIGKILRIVLRVIYLFLRVQAFDCQPELLWRHKTIWCNAEEVLEKRRVVEDHIQVSLLGPGGHLQYIPVYMRIRVNKHVHITIYIY